MKSRARKTFSKILVMLLIVATLIPTFAISTSALSYGGSASYRSGKYYAALTRVQLTGNQRTDIVNVARSQIGYQEGANSSQLSGAYRGSADCTEYGRWYGLQDMWCAMFVSWCANTAGVSTSVVPKHAYTPSGLNWFKNRGLAHSRASVARGEYTPQPGDIIYFKSKRNSNITNHVGIVTSYSNGIVYTVEGNTSSATISTNGGAVAAKSYRISNTYIVYICSPRYSGSGISGGSGNTSAPAPQQPALLTAQQNEVFNSTYYANKYSDLKSTLGTDANALYTHFINNGIKEGRQASPIFSVKHYVENNADLKASFKTDYQHAYTHFMSTGCKEVRDTAPYVDLGSSFYAEIRNVNSGLNLTVNSANEVLTAHDDSSDIQTWKFIRQSDGSYKIVNQQTGKCLDCQGSTYAAGAKVQTYTDNGSNAQRWYIHEAAAGGKYVLRPKCASTCVLDVKNASKSANAPLQSYTFNGNAAQQFIIEKRGLEAPKESATYNTTYYANKYSDLKAAFGTDATLLYNHFLNEGIKEGRQASPIFSVKYYVENNADLKAAFKTDYKNAYNHFLSSGYKEVRNTAPYVNLGADFYAEIRNVNAGLNVATNASGAVMTARDNSSDAQTWRFVRQSDGSYKIVNKQTGKCLDCQGASYSAGAKVQTYTDNGSNAQRWYIHEVSPGRYVLRPKCASTCVLDVKNASKAENAALQSYTFNANAAQHFIIDKATTPPAISNIQVTNVDATGYTVTCTVTAAAGVKEVLMPTWTEKNGQDDLVWHAATKNGNTYSFRVKVADHKSEGGNYITHIYAYDNKGVSVSAKVPAQAIQAATPPTLSNIQITDVDSTGYTVTCTATAEVGIQKVLMPTWTEKNGKDDLVWHTATKNGNTYTFRVNTSNHKNESGQYITHVYAYDNNGAYAVVNASAPKIAPITITNVKVTDLNASGFTLSCTVTATAGVKEVRVPAWTELNGQDDLIWHTTNKNGNTYSVRINTKDHKSETGDYITQIYAYDNNGAAYAIKVAKQYIRPVAAPVVSNVQITNVDPTGYTVTCTATSDAGIEKVLVPTWTEKNGKDDLVWHTATKNGNTYTFRVNTSDHKNESGQYITHVYAYDILGNYTCVAPDTIIVDPIAITNVKVTNLNATGFTLSCTVTATAGVKEVRVPAWTELNGQDDLIWHSTTKNGNTYSVRINTKDHKNETGDYITEIYAYDNNGAVHAIKVAKQYIRPVAAPAVSNIQITNVDATGYTVTCTATSAVGIQKVDLATWTENNGQDDLLWSNTTQSGNTFTYRVKTSDHKNESGKYITHVYAYDTMGNKTCVVADTVTVNPIVISNVTVTNKDATGYTVTCTVTATAGVKKVDLATWTENNGQDDLLWSNTTQSGNTFTYRVKISDHKNERGTYNTHIYAYDNNGALVAYKIAAFTV